MATTTATTKTRKLGKDQTYILRCIREKGSWYGGCGWIWDTYSATVRLLDSLVQRGLVYRKFHAARGWTAASGVRQYPAYFEYLPVRPDFTAVEKTAYRNEHVCGCCKTVWTSNKLPRLESQISERAVCYSDCPICGQTSVLEVA